MCLEIGTNKHCDTGEQRSIATRDNAARCDQVCCLTCLYAARCDQVCCLTCLYVVSRSNASRCGLVTVSEFAAAKHKQQSFIRTEDDIRACTLHSQLSIVT